MILQDEIAKNMTDKDWTNLEKAKPVSTRSYSYYLTLISTLPTIVISLLVVLIIYWQSKKWPTKKSIGIGFIFSWIMVTILQYFILDNNFHPKFTILMPSFLLYLSTYTIEKIIKKLKPV